MRHPGVVLHLVLLLLLSLPSRVGAQGPDTVAASTTVTFEEAVRIALSNGRDVRLAAQDVLITAEGRNVASARWLPRLDASGDYTALSEPPTTIIQGTPIQTADKNIWRARLTAEQTIYDFGRTRSRVDQAEARTDVAVLAARGELLDFLAFSFSISLPGPGSPGRNPPAAPTSGKPPGPAPP
jgi:outer membrane protein TolC